TATRPSRGSETAAGGRQPIARQPIATRPPVPPDASEVLLRPAFDVAPAPEMDPATQPDDRANEHLHTAEDEEHRRRGHRALGEEQEAAHREPDAQEHVVRDAQRLVAVPSTTSCVSWPSTPRPPPPTRDRARVPGQRIQPLRDRLAAPAAPQHDPLPPREGRAATGPRRLRPSPGHATRAGDVSRARQRDARARQRGRGGRRRPLRHLTARVAVGAYTSSPPPPPQPVAVDARVASR